jgi:Zn2+/Cd2+-exporting ATPase
MSEISTVETAVLRIAGMDCAEEVSLLRKGLASVPGVRDLKFDVINSRLTVEYDPAVSELDVIHAAIHHIGMTSEPWGSGGRPIDPWLSRNGRLVASALSGFCLLLAVLDDAHLSRNWILAFLTQGGAGSPATLYRNVFFGMAMLSGIWFTAPKAWRSLRSWHPDMNVLMLVSVFGALVLREYSEAATVCFLFSLANLLEVWSMARALAGKFIRC